MKKLFYILLISVVATACKKTEFEPEGPTDVRVRNISDVTFTEVTVKIDEESYVLGDIPAGEVSSYQRYETAYPLAEISANIDGVIFTTGPVDNTYSQYMGLVRITYVVYISNLTNKELKIDDVIYEEPLVLK